MSEKVHVGARVSRDLADALQEAANEVNTSKSELIRHYLSDGVLNDDADLPDYLVRGVKRERMKRRNKDEWRRVYFPKNVAKKFRSLFEDGVLNSDMNPEATDRVAEMYVEEAELMFDDDERREAAIEFVEAVADHANKAEDASEFDRLDPTEMFERYAGVEDGRSREGFEDVVADARNRLGGSGLTQGASDEDALVRSLANEHDVSESVARDAVEAAKGGVES